MGNNFNSNYSKIRSQQQNKGKLLVLPHVGNSNRASIKPLKKKMETKILMFLFNCCYGVLIFINIENFKGWALFSIGLLYGVARLFFYVIKQNQERRMRELDIMERQRKVAETSK
jgi:hypothetical protein